jgi:alkylated DNA repair dioxygenase AlkB
MSSLFALEPVLPVGFSYLPDFISKEEETSLLQEISTIELHTFMFQGYEAKRRVASFGYDYSFEKRALAKGKDFPPAFDWLVERTAGKAGVPVTSIAELLVTEYPVGSVINWHRDAPPFDLIAGISLHADCTFRLRPQEKAKQGRGSIISLPVHRRSLYLMHGESRSEWQHSISPVKDVRYSITLRTLRSANETSGGGT